MIINRDQVTVRKVDSALDIAALFDGTGFSFDVALGMLHGRHGEFVNRVSDRAYFILDGSFTVRVGDETHPVGKHDIVVIPAGSRHGISGAGEYLIITGPPFAPENEEAVGG